MSEEDSQIRIPLTEEIAVVWDEADLRAAGKGQDSPQPWRLEGEIDWNRWQSLRVLSSAYDDGALLVLASLRPRGAEGHDRDIVAALHGRPDKPPTRLEDVLPSLQQGEDGLERFNLEASEAEGHGIVRAAGDVEGQADAPPVARCFLQMQMAGARGFGTFDVFSRP